MYNVIIEHLKLLTINFTQRKKGSTPSKLAGLSGIMYILPVFFIKENGFEMNLYKLLWILNAIFVISSDYFFYNTDSIIHGIDRWLATLNVIISFIITLQHYPFWKCCIYVFPPLYFVYKSKVAENENDYIFNHTMWHVTGPTIVSYILYQIQLNSKIII